MSEITTEERRSRTERIVALLAKVSFDELWIAVGAGVIVLGVALIYLPAAVILAGLCFVVYGIGEMRA